MKSTFHITSLDSPTLLKLLFTETLLLVKVKVNPLRLRTTGMELGRPDPVLVRVPRLPLSTRGGEQTLKRAWSFRKSVRRETWLASNSIRKSKIKVMRMSSTEQT
jgi:hypothetical protein